MEVVRGRLPFDLRPHGEEPLVAIEPHRQDLPKRLVKKPTKGFFEDTQTPPSTHVMSDPPGGEFLI